MEEQMKATLRGTLALVLQHPDDGEWRDDASCKKMGNTMFFQTLHNRDKEVKAIISGVKTICGSCPVQKNCLDFAVRNEIKDGIWGGMTSAERKQAFPRVSVMGQRRSVK